MPKATTSAAASSPAMSMEIARITPSQAKRWLDVDNHRNRAIRPSRVSYLADEITSGRWQVTHSGIAFDAKGNLLDGQHRLAAIVKAGVAVEIVVMRNVPTESYIAMDRGSVRSIADVLRSDQRATGVAMAIVRQVQLVSYSAGVAPEDVRLVAEALQPEIALANSVRLSRPLARVQLRGALALRLSQSGAGWADLLMEQWRALNQTDTPKIDGSSATLMRRLLSADTPAIQKDRLMALGWQAFDPTQRERRQFHIDAAAQREFLVGARGLIRMRAPQFNPKGSRLERALAAAETPDA